MGHLTLILDDVPQDKNIYPQEVNAAQSSVLSPKTKSHVEDVPNHRPIKQGKFSAFHQGGKMKQPGFSSKLSGSRPPSVSNTESVDAHSTTILKSSRSFRGEDMFC